MHLRILLIALVMVIFVPSCGGEGSVPTSTAVTIVESTSPPISSPTFTPTSTATFPFTPTPTIVHPSLTPTITVTPHPPTLRELASARDFNIGVLFGGYGFRDYYRKLINIQTSEFNLALLYLDMTLTQPEQGKFDFGAKDNDIPFAIDANMKIVGHPLVWFDAVPDWVKAGKFTKDDLIDIMVSHITTMMTRYKGKVKAWVVVNEAYVSPKDDIFYNKIGPEYVEIAFEAARKADPSAILIYNEFDNHTPSGKYYQHTLEIIQTLKSKNLVDAVGLQMHLQGDEPPDKQDVIKAMQSYGLPIYVTEFDVNMRNVSGTQEERFAQQAKIYQEMLAACLESGVCHDFIIFGIVDKFSVWEKLQLWASSPNADPTPFDDNFRPKPAYYSMLEALSGK